MEDINNTDDANLKFEQIAKRLFELEQTLHMRNEQHLQEIEKLETQLAAQQQKEVTLQAALQDVKNNSNPEKHNSSEPWVEIKSANYDEVKGINIALDWNPAFIEYLKTAGITARDEDTIVQKWLAMLCNDLVEKLEQQTIDNSDKRTTNDFI